MTKQNLYSSECAQPDMQIENSNAFVCSHKISPYSTGLLSHLTFAVKDNIDTAGRITGYGSPSWGKSHPPAITNALCVDQLLADGATCLGKTISDELAYSLIGMNPFYGTPLNPKAPNRVPGGSSSGSASAVASGLVDFALGTDTGGSIRVPASNCGVWGYRPSHGAISSAGVATLAPSFDTVGVIAQNGKILQQVIKSLLGNLTTTSKMTPTIYFVSDVFELCDVDVIDKTNTTVAELSNHYSTQRIRLADITEKQVDCHWLFELTASLLSAEAWNTLGAWITAEKPELSPDVQYNLENYAKPTNRKDIQKWIQASYLFQTKLNTFLNKGNLLCFPTTPVLAPRIEAMTTEFIQESDYYPKSMGINAISGLSNTPQITIPVTQQPNEVPIGLSFLAGHGCDAALAEFCVSLRSSHLELGSSINE